jgi:hypothetical protein
MTLTYTELFAVLVSDLEVTIKRRKNDANIRFGYGGIEYDIADRTERMALIQRISDDYVKAHADVNQRNIDAWVERGGTGERPVSLTLNTALIDRLADAVLDEEITDPNPYKVQHNEYPFFSQRQLDLRRDRETSLKAAEEVGTDGRDYRVPKRRRRTNYENWRVDAGAKIRNEERAARYERDIAPGKVVTYNLRENGGELTEPFVQCRGVSTQLHK